MNFDLVTLNEVNNDGTLIHLYWNKEIGIWIAYGCSAYALRLLIKARGSESLRCFSDNMQKPCIMVSETVINNLIKSNNVISKIDDGYILLGCAKEFSEENYDSWVNKLREECNLKEKDQDGTFISQKIPNGFIKDNMSSFSRNTKRIIDLFTSTCALIIFFPLMLICYIAVRLEDGGSAIFKQERIGRFGKPFYIYKFRSMRLDAEKMGPQLSSTGGEGDPRLTRVGAFIRAHHLDELPQLWNVFLGNMAFVGPRPERLYYIEQILEYDQRYTYLYQIRPGVTSYATLYNGYTDTIEKMLRRLEYDLYYLHYRSIWLDIIILFKTFYRIVFGKVF